MTSAQPPRLATWLLTRFRPGGSSDALIGDLIEEFGRRRSRVWYWRQALAAVAMLTWQDVTTHKLLLMRVLLLGWMSAYLTSIVAAQVVFGRQISAQSLQWGDPRLTVVFTILCAAATVSGWVIARTAATHRAPMILSYITACLVVSAIALPWNSQFVTGEMFLSLLPLHLAYGFVGLPLSIMFGAALASRRHRFPA